MLFAHWMLLVASLLPIVAVSFAKVQKGYDNRTPRDFIGSLPVGSLGRRMAAAQENSWEALMMFAPALLLATWRGVDAATLNILAGVFIAARWAYLWCYAKDLATARSSVWFVGVLCVLGLYIASALV